MSQSDRLKILNFNVWHGMGRTSFLSIKHLEDGAKKRFEKRVKLQIQEIKKLDPDIVFLQEVNPLKPLALRYARELNMDFIYQVDNCGLKFFELINVPQHFCSGLVILAKKQFQLSHRASRKLSGGLGFCTYPLSVQFHEFRYALSASVRIRLRDNTFYELLLVNTHFHHGEGLENKDHLRKLSQLSLSSKVYERLQKKMKKSSKRRFREAVCLLSFIEKEKKKASSVILAGDFNDRPQSLSIKALKEEFKAGYELSDQKLEPTFDSRRNSNIKKVIKKVRSPHQFSKGVNLEERKKLSYFFSELDLMPRKIDYVFFDKKSVASERLKLETYHLFGDQKIVSDSEELFLSDHFGIMLSLQIRRKVTRLSDRPI